MANEIAAQKQREISGLLSMDEEFKWELLEDILQNDPSIAQGKFSKNEDRFLKAGFGDDHLVFILAHCRKLFINSIISNLVSIGNSVPGNLIAANSHMIKLCSL